MAPLSVADFLSARGHQVTVVYATQGPAPLLGRYIIGGILGRLSEQGVQLRFMEEVVAIGPDVVDVRNVYSGRTATIGDVDSVVLACGSVSDSSLYDALKHRLPEIHILGDAYAPRRLVFATRQAYALAEHLVRPLDQKPTSTASAGLARSDQHRVPHRCERRRVGEVHAGELIDRHPVPQRHGNGVDALGAAFASDDLAAEQQPVAPLGEHLDRHRPRARKIAGPGSRLDRDRFVGEAGSLRVRFQQSGPRDLQVAHLADGRPHDPGEGGVSAADVRPDDLALLVRMSAERHVHVGPGHDVKHLHAVATGPHLVMAHGPHPQVGSQCPFAPSFSPASRAMSVLGRTPMPSTTMSAGTAELPGRTPPGRARRHRYPDPRPPTASARRSRGPPSQRG